MRVILNIIGVLLILTGLVWILQGVNVLLGSFMSGRPEYSVLGVVVAAVGVGLVIYANRRARRTGG